jgi:hypothetical protein
MPPAASSWRTGHARPLVACDGVPAMRRGAVVAASVASGAVASVALAAPWGNPFRVKAARRRRES